MQFCVYLSVYCGADASAVFEAFPHMIIEPWPLTCYGRGRLEDTCGIISTTMTTMFAQSCQKLQRFVVSSHMSTSKPENFSVWSRGSIHVHQIDIKILYPRAKRAGMYFCSTVGHPRAVCLFRDGRRVRKFVCHPAGFCESRVWIACWCNSFP